mmetsp:Transcript_9280/g.23104  ORF Transcript_9280/g.23104 Transcript_9280/m.23104 type:complete len:344 (+) Transcript_9280:220-1251(+)
MARAASADTCAPDITEGIAASTTELTALPAAGKPSAAIPKPVDTRRRPVRATASAPVATARPTTGKALSGSPVAMIRRPPSMAGAWRSSSSSACGSKSAALRKPVAVLPERVRAQSNSFTAEAALFADAGTGAGAWAVGTGATAGADRISDFMTTGADRTSDFTTTGADRTSDLTTTGATGARTAAGLAGCGSGVVAAVIATVTTVKRVTTAAGAKSCHEGSPDTASWALCVASCCNCSHCPTMPCGSEVGAGAGTGAGAGAGVDTSTSISGSNTATPPSEVALTAMRRKLRGLAAGPLLVKKPPEGTKAKSMAAEPISKLIASKRAMASVACPPTLGMVMHL